MKTFHVGIKAIIQEGDKVLILKTRDKNGIWEMPGGRINGDETIEQALCRELTEELLNIKNIQIHELLDVFRLQKDIKGDTSLVLIFYKVTADFDGNPCISDEHTDWRWATKSEALELVEEASKQAIKKAYE